MFLFGLLILLDDVGVGDANAEIDRVGDRVVGLTVFVRRVGVGVEAVDPAVPGLHFELLVVPPLLLFLSGPLHLLGLRHIHLIAMHLVVVIEFLLPLPGLPSLLLIHLVL